MEALKLNYQDFQAEGERMKNKYALNYFESEGVM